MNGSPSSHAISGVGGAGVRDFGGGAGVGSVRWKTKSSLSPPPLIAGQGSVTVPTTLKPILRRRPALGTFDVSAYCRQH